MALDYLVIGERIKRARIENDMTQENLAERLNVSVAYVSRIECGTTRLNLTRLIEICRILDIDEGILLNGTSVESQNYLSEEFSTLLKGCSQKTQRLIYNVAKVIIQSDNK